LKFYDSGKDEADPGNYYMEREWRILGNLKFESTEVSRIILPNEEYAAKACKIFPEFAERISLIV